VRRREIAGDKRIIARGESVDMISWNMPTVVLYPDENDPEDTQFYGMAAFPYQGEYLGFLWAYHTDAENIDVQLVHSRDTVKWERVGNREAFIPNGEKGSFDSGMALTCAYPVILDDEIRIYYSGFSSGHDVDGEQQAAIGMATLRCDGFVSVDADAEGGVLMTEPLTPKENQLLINAQASDGYIAAEILDESAQPLAGFSRDDCDRFTGDDIQHAVTWSGKANLDALRNKKVRLKFYLCNAKLFSMHV